MATVRLKIVRDCVNQETGKRLSPGEIVEMGEMEAGRHLAEKNAVPAPARTREKQVVDIMEKRGG